MHALDLARSEGNRRDSQLAIDASLEDTGAAGDRRHRTGDRGDRPGNRLDEVAARRGHGTRRVLQNLPVEVDAALPRRDEEGEELPLGLVVALVSVRPAVDGEAELRRNDVE